ncbi:hypothetical protein HER14_09965 [Acidithiobacillus thiooxidans]|uniref:hypothetical protein n=1 Tax=Acidithiobacillus thiooxidans TaxID=930 RepID=UPI001C065849|nr:hypothetical protein [Acidithiobacillus thiooxidans]MBU2751252.1 hypothetical protein [Acidithiobacillus thiooxidans]
MQKGFGFAAIIIAVISFFIPFIGPWLTILTALLAILAYGPGFSFGLAAIIVNFLNIYLSPSIWAMNAMRDMADGHQHTPYIPYTLFAVQIVSLIILIFINIKQNKVKKIEQK